MYSVACQEGYKRAQEKHLPLVHGKGLSAEGRTQRERRREQDTRWKEKNK